MEVQNIKITTGDNRVMEGELTLPEKPIGVIIFSHGSGSSRFSPRNRMVAKHLSNHNFATLLIDLLTKEEDSIYANRFDINLLALRLNLVTEWVKSNSKTKDLDIGYFGASTGAASALQSAAQTNNHIKSVVSRGGRPDLVLEYLPNVKSPTLLIVGANDPAVIEFNKQAFHKIKAKKELQIIAGATHLFEEPGKLEEVAELALNWYLRYFPNKKPTNKS